jgi:two-component system phosphate regulon sensor histidine kinase PhoR
LDRPFRARFAFAALVGLWPAAVALVALAASGAVSLRFAGVVLLLSLALGAIAMRAMMRSWRGHDDRLEAVASAILRRQLPSETVPNDREPVSAAERHLIQAADALVSEVRTLAAQGTEFGAILRSMSEAVVVTGPSRNVVLLNGAAHRMFALPTGINYRGRDLIELCRDPRLQEFVERASAAGQNEVISAEILMQTPAPRALQVSAAPVRHNPTTAAACVFVFHDITRLKSYETARTDFIANLTHELRTPLTALYGYAETLAKGVEDAATERRFLSIIERQSRRLARLIDDLVSLSDLERGLTPLKVEALEPARLIEETVELMVEQARRAGVAIEVQPSTGQPALIADRDRLHQVMINLVDNAIKYTPRGGTVTLGTRAFAAADHFNGAPAPGVEFVVADSGEGIPASHLSRLTERFYRVDRARSRELGGTGLGLAIVKHIVQLHRGTLKIESRVREGTTVTIWLPREPPTPEMQD